MNIKPTKRFNIGLRLGFASGAPKTKNGQVMSYPVDHDGQLIEKWRREEVYSDTERTTFAIPMDIKFSWYTFNKKGKVQGEIYFALENVLSIIPLPSDDTTFNQYTGKEEAGSSSGGFDMPIPMPSFGFKWNF
jgi:hypothetical protein